MATDTERKRRRSFYYGWIILPFVALSPIGTSVGQGLGPGVTPVTRDFGWTRAFYMGGQSIGGLLSGIFAPVLGNGVDRFGARFTLWAGWTIVGLAGWIMSFETGAGLLWYAGWLLVYTFNATWSGFPSQFKIASMWFLQRRGLTIGLILAVAAILTFPLPMLNTLFMDSYGWRTNFRIFGTAAIIVALITYLVNRSYPEDKGYHIDGAPMTPEERAEWAQRRGRPTQAAPQAGGEYSFTWVQAIKTPQLWILAIASFVNILGSTIQTAHQIPFLEGMGVPRVTASVALGFMTLMSAPGRMGFGWLADIFGRQRVRFLYAVCFVLQLIAMNILLQARSMDMVWVFVAIFGIGQGSALAAGPVVVAAYFGREAFGTVYGIRLFIVQFAQVFGPVGAGYIFDTTGSYQIAFMIVIVGLVLSIILLLLPWAAAPKVPIGAADSR